jgi:hypothetical protein
VVPEHRRPRVPAIKRGQVRAVRRAASEHGERGGGVARGRRRVAPEDVEVHEERREEGREGGVVRGGPCVPTPGLRLRLHVHVEFVKVEGVELKAHGFQESGAGDARKIIEQGRAQGGTMQGGTRCATCHERGDGRCGRRLHVERWGATGRA